MDKRIKICDRCGQEIERKPPWNKLKIMRYKRWTRARFATSYGYDPYDWTEEGFDLCHKCAKDFKEWIKNEII